MPLDHQPGLGDGPAMPMKVKVLFFLPVLGGGGAEMNAVRLAGALSANGVEPVYVTARAGGSYARFLPPGTATHVLDTGSVSSSTLRLMRSVRPLAELIDAERPDIVCPVLSRTSIAAIAAMRRARHKPRLVLSIQNALSGQFTRSNDPMTVIQRYLTRRWWPSADAVIALSEGVAAEVAEYVPELRDRIEVIHNVGKPLDSQLSEMEAREDTLSDPGAPRLIACGRLTEQKGYPDMLRALACIDTSPAPVLDILGEGPLEKDLRQLAANLGIAERVNFLGFRQDPLSYMSAADIFVLSSLWEGFGNVIVEAMAAGTAVVSTDCKHGPAEIIEDGKTGLLVPVGQPDMLAAAIKRLIEDPALRNQLAAEGLKRAEDFSADRIGREYALAFARIAGKSRMSAAA